MPGVPHPTAIIRPSLRHASTVLQRGRCVFARSRSQCAQSVRLYVAKLSSLVLPHLGIHFGTHLEHIMVNWCRYGNIFTVARHWFPAPSHPHHTITTFQYILQLPQTSSHFSLQLPAIHSYKYSSTAFFSFTHSTFQKCACRFPTLRHC